LELAQFTGSYNTFDGTAFSSLPSFDKFKSTGLPADATSAFSNMVNLVSVDMSGWTGTNALSTLFQGCVKLESVTLPPNVTTIATGFSVGCPKIRYYVGSNTTFTVSGDNVMLFKGTTLAAANGATGDVTVPANVTVFSNYAFTGAPLTKADMSACPGLTSIGQYVFQNCTALAELIFSTSTTTISEYAFDGCTALRALFPLSY
jgi:hypothetical protein